MKFVIIIAIAFVLLIPYAAFAQSDPLYPYDPIIGTDVSFSSKAITVENVSIDESLNTLIVKVSSPPQCVVRGGPNPCELDRTLIITINRNFMDSKTSLGVDEMFVTLVNGIERENNEISKGGINRSIQLEIPSGFSNLKIIGTEIFKKSITNADGNSQSLSTQGNTNSYEKQEQSEQENIQSVKKQSCFLFWCWDVEPNPKSNDNSFSSTLEEVMDAITPKPYNLYTYSINPIPDVPNKSIPSDAIKKSLSVWEENNPDIEFIETDDSPHMVINWKIYEAETHQGVANCIFYDNGDVRDCELDISLGQNDCNGNYVQQDVNNVSNTIMHEMGHSFGLRHSNDENHLMYGDDGSFQIDDLGYEIPLPFDESYVGQKTLDVKYDALQSKIDTLEPKISQLESEYDLINAQYSQYDGKTLPLNEYQKAMSLYDELNRINSKLSPLISESNDYVYQLNDLVEIINCFPNVESTLDSDLKVIFVPEN
jgi:hypothetical protein